jgi:hypothetical protein
MTRLIHPARALNGATMTNAQPPLLLAAGLPLPKSAALPERSPDGGATADGSPEADAAAGELLEAVLATGAGLAGAGTGTDETCEA